jgi:hypothetical protein
MTEPYYKWLRPDHSGAYGYGDYRAYLPHDTRPGKWLPVVADPTPCQRGYHLVTIEHLPKHWVVPGVLYEAECRGATVAQEDKVACAQIRLTRRVGTLTPELAVAFAADCAEHVLGLFETAFPGDDRPRRAIEAARACIANPTPENRATARAATGDAAWATGDAAQAASSAAAWAAQAATGDAARAAWATGDAARAAWATAEDAAWAAWAAWAARDAAQAAAWAAWDAWATGDAGNAERTWQGTHLIELLERRP